MSRRQNPLALAEPQAHGAIDGAEPDVCWGDGGIDDWGWRRIEVKTISPDDEPAKQP